MNTSKINKYLMVVYKLIIHFGFQLIIHRLDATGPADYVRCRPGRGVIATFRCNDIYIMQDARQLSVSPWQPASVRLHAAPIVTIAAVLPECNWEVDR